MTNEAKQAGETAPSLESRVRSALAELDALYHEALDAGDAGRRPNGDDDGLVWAEHISRASAELQRALAGPEARKAERRRALANLEAGAPETFEALAALAIRLHEHGGDLLFQLMPGHFLAPPARKKTRSRERS